MANFNYRIITKEGKEKSGLSEGFALNARSHTKQTRKKREFLRYHKMNLLSFIRLADVRHVVIQDIMDESVYMR